MADKEDELRQEIERLKKVNQTLVDKALQKQESSESFMMFQQNALLTSQIRERTTDFEKLTESLKTEQNILESMILTIPGVIWFIKKESMSMKFFNLGILNLSSGSELQDLKTSRGNFGDVVQSTLKNMVFGVQMISLDMAIKNHPKIERLEVTLSSKDLNDVVVFVQDRTEIHKQRQTIKNQELQIIQASRLASLGEMAAGVAHEINNPLAIISASSKVLLKLVEKQNIDRGVVTEVVQDINHTVKRIAQIVGAMRNLSRDSKNFDKQPVKIKTILEEVLSLCENRFKTSSVDLRVNITGEDIEREVLCDYVQFSQVLVNLLNNSFDAVQINEDKWVEIDYSSSPDFDLITVTDSGKGIPEETLKRIFDPFFTSKELGKGTGLGLSISKTIMEKHRGSISVDTSYPNTRFILQIPKT